MDPLDRLTERLRHDLDRPVSPGPECVASAVLERFMAGGLEAPSRIQVEAHLDGCLACVDRLVDLRDHLQGLAAPAPVSARLRSTLERLVTDAPRDRAPNGIGDRVRRAFAFRVPAWAAVGMAAAVIAVTWTAAARLQPPRVDWPFPAPGKEHLAPAHVQTTRTVSGVVRSIRDATSNGVEAHVVSLTDASGATFVLFAWGRPTIQKGDAVETDAIVTMPSEGGGPRVYQGIATNFRRAR